MPSKKPREKDEKPQSERFIETAREIGADETLEAFEQAFVKITKSKTPLRKKQAKDGSRS